jgi:hypothetical protein
MQPVLDDFHVALGQVLKPARTAPATPCATAFVASMWTNQAIG